MGTIYAVANQKGGVGKTTTAVNLAACVAEAGYETLLVDVDPQANATVGLGLPKDAHPSVYDVLSGEAELADTLQNGRVERLSVAPSHPDLAGAQYVDADGLWPPSDRCWPAPERAWYG